MDSIDAAARMGFFPSQYCMVSPYIRHIRRLVLVSYCLRLELNLISAIYASHLRRSCGNYQKVYLLIVEIYLAGLVDFGRNIVKIA
jgi:hypothetical protein